MECKKKLCIDGLHDLTNKAAAAFTVLDKLHFFCSFKGNLGRNLKPVSHWTSPARSLALLGQPFGQITNHCWVVEPQSTIH